MPDNKNSIRISILEKSFNYMERFLPLSIELLSYEEIVEIVEMIS